MDVKGFGTSYEYCGWNSASPGKTAINWYPFTKKFGREYSGEPKMTRNVKYPATTALMQDADEGKSPCTSGPGGPNVVGAPEGAATNNLPESWDNHAAKLRNVLYADGHVESLGRGYWENRIREHCGQQ